MVLKLNELSDINSNKQLGGRLTLLESKEHNHFWFKKF